ncbi:hypothetical protein BJY00DRAFT_301637 [Aspergillus carlsbadensis]|nr:hypothetical protein BJY00DRAFT_301637 [Aspergillus carlsbadensis]
MPLHSWMPNVFQNEKWTTARGVDIAAHRLHDEKALRRKKKLIQSLMEAEVEFLKREDSVFAKMMERQTELQRENATLRQNLTTLEADLQMVNSGRDTRPDRKTVTGETPTTTQEDGRGAPYPDPAPSINRVEWSLFIAAQAAKFAIDVLDGEPVLSFASHPSRSMASRGLEHKQEPIGVTGSKRKQLLPGQGSLPERIRINSPIIVKILQKIDPEAFGGAEHPLVMIRPYKALVYYEGQIRRIHQELVKKLQLSPSNGPAHPRAETKDTRNADDDGPIVSGLRGSTSEPDDTSNQNAASMTASEVLKDPSTSSQSALEQLEALIEFLDTDIKAKSDYLCRSQPEKVTFHDVWYLFHPGDEVISGAGKQAYRILNIASSPHKVIPPWRNLDTMSAKSDETPVQLHCVHIDFNGGLLGPVLTNFKIPRFDGERSVTSLPVFPLCYYQSGSMAVHVVRRNLIGRGKMLLDVLNQRHMHYNGLTLETREEVDGQVVVDFERAFEMDARRPRNANPDQSPEAPWDKMVKKAEVEWWQPKIVKDVGCDAGCCNHENIHQDAYAEAKRNADYQSSLIPVERSREPSVAILPRRINVTVPGEDITDEDYLIMSYRVFGFVLRSRKWAKLDLTHLHYIGENTGHMVDGGADKRESTFDQLVLDPNHKRVLQSLVAQHYRDKQSASSASEQVDIVRGKGKGLIILLHGAPGVGKTTTAEGVAELFGKPLFQITCGDLGTTAQEVEDALETNFALASRWGCILLLDEADVFLSKRTPHDFIRNGLVSVFLRVLEYYAGILFLTTNRIGDFDEAFTSRIHISLHYPQLTLQATREIFELNIRLMQQRFAKKERPLQVDDTEILQYAGQYWNQHKTMRWNGRQIRNACQTALALAEFDAGGGSHEQIVNKNAQVRLGVAHLDVVCRAYLEFMRYLRRLYKTDQDRLAQKRGYRARESQMTEKYFSDEEVSPHAAVTAGYPLTFPQMLAPPHPGGMGLAAYGGMQMQPTRQQQQQFQFQQQQQQQAQMWQAMNPSWQQMMFQGQVPPIPGPAAPGKE